MRILLVYNTQLEAGGISIDESQYIWDDLEKLIGLLDQNSSKPAYRLTAVSREKPHETQNEQ